MGHMSKHKSKQADNIGTILPKISKRENLTWKETKYYLVVKTNDIDKVSQQTKLDI